VIFSLVCAVGLLGGLAVRALWERPSDRAHAAITLFENWCIVRLSGETPILKAPLRHISGWEGNEVWIDPDSEISLQLSQGSCDVVDDKKLMTPSERDTFLQLVTERVTHWAPVLQPTEGTVAAYNESKAWVSPHPPDDPQRWGIILVRAEMSGPESFTLLSLALPTEARP
jgi:hypothetical protein